MARKTKKRVRRKPRKKKLTNKKLWEGKFFEKVKLVHKRNLLKVVNKILRRSTSAKNSMVQRSKKKGVFCNITLEEIRELIFENYGKECCYCGKILIHNNMVFDHIIPLSKNGPSTKENIQIICKSSNGMKGSLEEKHFLLLLEWLDTVPLEMKKDISIRLARGFH